MIERVLTEIWADARTASPERRLLVVITIGTALITGAVAEIRHPVMIAALVVFSTIAAVQPATNAGLVVMGIILVRWVAIADDPVGPWSIAVATGLIVVHLCLALMASTPHSARLPRTLLARWILRGAWLAAATAGTWLLTVLFDRRDAQGSTLLTAAALLSVAGGAIAARVRANDSSDAHTSA